MALEINAGEAIAKIMNMLIGISVVIVAIVGTWYGYKFKQYRYTCHIYTKRAEGESALTITKGGYFKAQGDAWIFKLRNNRHALVKPPANKYIWKIGRSSVIHLRNIGENQFIPFNPTFDTKSEETYLQKVDYDENISWYLSIIDLIKEHLSVQEFWEKYGSYIVIFASIVMCIVALYLTYEYATAGLGDVRGLTDALRGIMAQSAGGGGAP